MTPIGVAVIGLGWWGRIIMGHLAASPRFDVVVVADPASEAREFARAAGVTAASELGEALVDQRVEAVVLCTPHRLHAEQIRACAAAGKHVFCEKPLCATVAEASSAIDAVTSAGVQIGVGHEKRFEQPVLDLLAAVAQGELGKLLVVEGNFSQDKFLDLPRDNWRLSADFAPVGPLSATGIHLVDLSVALLGQPTDVLARLSSRGAGFANGDTLTTTVGFASGASASITAVLATPFIGRLMVIGSTGWTEIRDRSHPESPSGWDVTHARRGEPLAHKFLAPHSPVRANLDAFAAAVRGEQPYPIPRAQMLATVAASDAITRSAASGAVEPVF